jgi:hypothetical protein
MSNSKYTFTFITGGISPNGKTKKFEIFNEHLDSILKTNNTLIENKEKNLKIKFLKEKVFEMENINGTAHIWLVYSVITQMFNYIIQLKINKKDISAELIYFLIKNIEYNKILKALEELGININKNNNTFNYDIFSWSFPLKSILLKSNITIPLDPNNEYWKNIDKKPEKKKLFLETFGNIEHKSNITIPLDPTNEYWNNMNRNPKKREVFLQTFGNIPIPLDETNDFWKNIAKNREKRRLFIETFRQKKKT